MEKEEEMIEMDGGEERMREMDGRKGEMDGDGWEKNGEGEERGGEVEVDNEEVEGREKGDGNDGGRRRERGKERE